MRKPVSAMRGVGRRGSLLSSIINKTFLWRHGCAMENNEARSLGSSSQGRYTDDTAHYGEFANTRFTILSHFSLGRLLYLRRISVVPTKLRKKRTLFS